MLGSCIWIGQILCRPLVVLLMDEAGLVSRVKTAIVKNEPPAVIADLQAGEQAPKR